MPVSGMFNFSFSATSDPAGRGAVSFIKERELLSVVASAGAYIFDQMCSIKSPS